MSVNFTVKMLALVLVVFLTASSQTADRNENADRKQPASLDDSVRQLLLAMKWHHRSTDQLAVLFRIGDERITELIGALSDSDDDVRLNAQIVIRYLGNADGMTAWIRAYESDQGGSMTAPIPTPLRTWDYQFIRSVYLRDDVTTEPLMEAYLFALALDGSPPAITLLSEVIVNARKRGFNLDEGRYLQIARAKKIDGKQDLATSVLERATFLDLNDRKDTSAKVLAYTTARDKALVEIFVNRGPLAQEWYHVVVSRSEKGWKLFSITQTAVS